MLFVWVALPKEKNNVSFLETVYVASAENMGCVSLPISIILSIYMLNIPEFCTEAFF